MKKVLIILLGIALAVGLFFVFKVNDFYKAIYRPGTVGSILKPKPPKTNYSFLLLGYGGGAHDGAYLTDTMMIININTKTKKVHLISIPRDLWVKLPTKSGSDFHAKVNTIYQTELFPNTFPDVDTKDSKSKDDATLTKLVTGGITGLTVDNYGGIDFAGFAAVIDKLGGVDVKVEKTFDDYEYPIDGKEKELCGKDEDFKKIEPFLNGQGDPSQSADLFKDKPDLEKFYKDITDDPVSAFPCRYEHIHFDKGTQHMDGKTALKYVRSRHSLQDGSDFGRATRQQHLIEAVKDKILTVSFIPKIVPLMDELKQYVKTDVPPETIQVLIKEIPHVNEYKITTIVLTTENSLQNGRSNDGQYILIPQAGMDNWAGVRKIINNSILGITPTPTPGPTTKLSPKPTKKISP